MVFMKSSFLIIALALICAVACGSDEGDPSTDSPAVDEAEREFERKLNSPLPDEQLAALNEVLEAWVMQKGEPPESLEEFVHERHLKQLPSPPAGRRFMIDRKAMRVVLR